MKGYYPEGFWGQVYHVHVRYPGDWKELYFRDYLQEHPDIAVQYGALKEKLKIKFEHDRDGYIAAKTCFISHYTELAWQKYTGRYKPE